MWMRGPATAGLALVAVLWTRTAMGGSDWWQALVINVVLALACLPLAALATRGRRLRPLSAVLWLLVWPNALYMVTDLAHLRRTPEHLWLDVASYGAFAAVGIWIGVASLNRVLLTVARWWLRVPLGWTLCALGGLGIWLGWVKRFNSWDAWTRPRHLADELMTVMADGQQIDEVLLFVGLFGGGMAFASACVAPHRWLPTRTPGLGQESLPGVMASGRSRVPPPWPWWGISMLVALGRVQAAA